MGRGQRAEVDAVLVDAADLVGAAERVDVVVVGARNEFRYAGAAAGQLEEGQVVRARSTVSDRILRHVGQRLELARLSAGDEHMAQRGGTGPGACRQFAVVVAAVFRGHDVRDRLGELAEVRDLRLAVGREGEDGQRADPEQCEDDLEELRDIGQLDHHPVALGDVPGEETGRQPVGAPVQLRVAPPDFRGGVDHGDPVRVRLGAFPEHGAERLAAPPARGPVPLGEVGRPGGCVVVRAHSSAPTALRKVRNLAAVSAVFASGTDAATICGARVEPQCAFLGLGAADRDDPLAVAPGVAPAHHPGEVAAVEGLGLRDDPAGRRGGGAAHGGGWMQGAGEGQGRDVGGGEGAGDRGGQVPHGGGADQGRPGGDGQLRAVRGQGLVDGVHDDRVLVQVLRGLQQCGGAADVLGEVGAARGGPGERIGDHLLSLPGDQQLRAGADEGAPGPGGQGEGVAYGVAAGQALEHPGQVQRGGGGEFEGAGEHHLAELPAPHAFHGRGDTRSVDLGFGYWAYPPVGRAGHLGGQRDQWIGGERGSDARCRPARSGRPVPRGRTGWRR